MKIVWDSLNARELSILIWAFVLLCFLLRGAETRKDFIGLLRAFFVWKIQVSLLASSVYVAVVVLTINRLGIWNLSDLKTTIVWFFFFAIYQI